MKEFIYKKIYMTPFKWFTLENFPFIEEDFDSMTSYALWCKLKAYFDKIAKNTNDVGEQVVNLTEAFITLQDYVENYLDNIDIAEDVSNKLDELVEDGTLARIINQDIFSEINKKLVRGKISAPSLLDSAGSEMITLLKTDNKAVLFDTGRNTSLAYNKQYLLNKLGDKKLDAIFISHYHGDHMGGLSGLKDLFSDDITVYLPLNFIPYYNGTDPTAPIIQQRLEVINFLNDNNINYIEVNDDLVINFEDFIIETRNSNDIAYSHYNSIQEDKYNSYSMNCLVHIGDTKILFPGDSTVDTQDYLLSKGQVEKVNIYCSAHHGYERYHNTEYMKILNPDYEFYSVAPVSWDSINLLQYDYGYNIKSKLTTQAYNDIEYVITKNSTQMVRGNYVNSNMFFNKNYDIYINPNYNGVPDGTLEHPYKSIAQALTYLPQTGCTITLHLADGDYSNIRLLNLKNTITISAINNNQVHFYNSVISNCNSLYITGIIFEDGANISYGNYYFNNCTFKKEESTTGNIAVTIQRALAHLYNCNFDNCYTGLYAQNNVFAEVQNCTFNCTQYCIYAIASYIAYLNNIITSGTLRQDIGAIIQALHLGNTSSRPNFNGSTYMRGYQYFDTQLGKPVYYYNVGATDRWVLADGTEA